jgi:predicted Zn-dependent protease
MPATPDPDASATPTERDLRRALDALRSRRPAEAERLAHAVLAARPGDPAAARILGQALLMLSRPGEAIGPLSDAARQGDDPATRTLLARALAGVGRSDEALTLLRAAAAGPLPFLPALLELADQLGRGGRLDEAVAAMERAIGLVPSDPLPRMTLGFLHLRRDDRARAREAFAHVRETAPERRDAMVALATVLALDGEPAAAADLYRAALKQRPDDPVTRINLAKCLLETGDRAAGEETLRVAAADGAAAAGMAIAALADTPHGRFFLRPSAAARFLAHSGIARTQTRKRRR